jgi:hypothetical protein
MPVPSDIADLSQTAGNNSPPGSESPTTADDYLRAQAAFIAMLRDGVGFSTEQDVASAATCDIGAVNSMFVRITGTTTITSFGTNYNGPRFIRFANALTLTHNASTLILPGGANITTVAGDNYVAIPISGGWVLFGAAGLATGAQVKTGTDTGRVVTPAALREGALVLGTATSLSGTAVDITGIPSWAKRVTITFSGLSTNGTSRPLLRLGYSGGIEATGYASLIVASSGSSVDSTGGFFLAETVAAATTLSGRIVLDLHNASHTWIATVSTVTSGGTLNTGGGTKTLTGALDRIRFTIANASDTFDAGTVNVMYE